MTDKADMTGMPVPPDMSGASALSGLSVSDVAERLGVSQRTVRRYIKQGKLPAERIHGEHGLEYRVSAPDVRNLEGQRAAIDAQPVTRTGKPDMPAIVPDMSTLALVAPLVQELTSAREQLERLARENGELRERLRIAEQGSAGKQEPATVDTETNMPRPWWRRLFR